MANKLNYKNMSYSELVNCRDFGKIDINFDEPNLLQMQRDSYQKFLTDELEKLIVSYSPVKHAKNNGFTTQGNCKYGNGENSVNNCLFRCEFVSVVEFCCEVFNYLFHSYAPFLTSRILLFALIPLPVYL